MTIQGALAAVQFLTRLPAGRQSSHDPRLAGEAVAWYPLVGGLVGILLALSAWVFDRWLGLPSGLVSVLCVGIWIAVTGALHLDGVADCADAWMGGHDRERMMEILQDTHCGTGAVLALILVVVIKMVAVSVLLEQGAWWALLVTPVVGRTMLVGVLCGFPYVREQGLGRGLRSHLDVPAIKIGVALGAVLLVLVSLPGFFAALAGASAAMLLLYFLLIKPLGGATGDVYGAVVEWTELFTLIGLVMVV
ncbi:MAG: adenosylcobinamide-GDP ribazoletransferase [Gammaproteobacteria bacterium]|nr:adenosylcobinamide-GDP ribazoletransferase [Gammaproteobacteria bacterium]